MKISLALYKIIGTKTWLVRSNLLFVKSCKVLKEYLGGSMVSISHISASRILKEMQVELQGNPTYVHLQCEVTRLRKEAMILGEAETSYTTKKLSVLI